MSARTLANLSHGLIVASLATAPDPYDVRSGVDNGAGEDGTLELPTAGNVRLGVSYGGDGDEFTGTLIVQPPVIPPTSRPRPRVTANAEAIDAFEELLEATAEVNGKKEFVTIDGKKHEAIVSEIAEDDAFVSGGVAGSNFRAMCRLSEFKTFEPKFQEAEARGQTLQILSANRNNGYIELFIGTPVQPS